MVTREVDISQFSELMSQLGDSMAMPDFTDVMTEWLVHVKEQTQESMLGGESPKGVAHAPLKRPRESGNTGPPLIDFGDLFGDLINIQEPRPDGATFGTHHDKNGSPVAVIHQYGTKDIPARPHTQITDEMVELAVKMVGDHLTAQLVEI